MSDISINPVLGELQRLAAAAGGETSGHSALADVNFASVLKTMLSGVNQIQQEAVGLAQAFELGESQTNLAQVMIAQQKARLAFQTTLQVRNKLAEAYQDIMNMPL